jgi:hypothetical protein
VDHTYTDYSIVDPDSLRLLDEEHGLSRSGYEWAGLNQDPYPPRLPTSGWAVYRVGGPGTGTGAGTGAGTGQAGGAAPAAAGDLAAAPVPPAGDGPAASSPADAAAAAAAALEAREATPEYRAEKERTLRKLRELFKGVRPCRRNSGGVVQPFPGKLMEVLDRDDLEDVILWMPHGRAFMVRQPKVFITDVLARFFKQSKYMSFTRQLNLWGFKRITRGRDSGAYYHELFLRGRPRLTLRMRRQKIKGTGIKQAPNPEAEPDLYAMAASRPLPAPRKRGDSGEGQKPLPPPLPAFHRSGAAGRPVFAPRVFSSSQEGGGGGGGAAGRHHAAAVAAAAAARAESSSSPGGGGRAGGPGGAGGGAPSPGRPSAPMSAADLKLGNDAAEAYLAAHEAMRGQGALAARDLLLDGASGAASSSSSHQRASPLEALLRLQAAEARQRHDTDAALRGLGLLRQIERATTGAPPAPAVTITELQQRLITAAAALDQPAVQAALMEEQRRAQLAALLAGGAALAPPPPGAPPAPLQQGGAGGGAGSSDLMGMLRRMGTPHAGSAAAAGAAMLDVQTLELLRHQRLRDAESALAGGF